MAPPTPTDLQATAAWDSYHQAVQTTQTSAAQEAALIQATPATHTFQATVIAQAAAAQRLAMELERERRLQPLRTYGP